MQSPIFAARASFVLLLGRVVFVLYHVVLVLSRVLLVLCRVVLVLCRILLVLSRVVSCYARVVSCCLVLYTCYVVLSRVATRAVFQTRSAQTKKGKNIFTANKSDTNLMNYFCLILTMKTPTFEQMQFINVMLLLFSLNIISLVFVCAHFRSSNVIYVIMVSLQFQKVFEHEGYLEIAIWKSSDSSAGVFIWVL